MAGVVAFLMQRFDDVRVFDDVPGREKVPPAASLLLAVLMYVHDVLFEWQDPMAGTGFEEARVHTYRNLLMVVMTAVTSYAFPDFRKAFVLTWKNLRENLSGI